LRLLDIGCGEGRNAVFFARNGYEVTAFDSSTVGLEKTKRLVAHANVTIEVIEANIREYRPTESFDVLFSTGVLHYVPPELRTGLLTGYREATNTGGLNVFSVFVAKRFIAQAPDAEIAAYPWCSGELLTHYHDWRIEFFAEEIINCQSSGMPHQHEVNRIVARKEPC
jgi:tellurite methyltransferase